MRLRLPIASLLWLTAAWGQTASAPLEVKVVVVTMFERGADTGDAAGELQHWVEREKLGQVIAFPQGFHDLRTNGNGVLAVLTGVGTARAAASISALGNDPRFDLRHAYWVVAGIAGVDPADASLGSAIWADWVVDGDLAHEIDAREIPSNWKTGYVPLRKGRPYETPLASDLEGQVYRLNRGLVQWAYEKTAKVELPDPEGLAERRRTMQGYPNAQRPPFVAIGATLQSSTFWHGRKLNEWANDWVSYFTGGAGNYMTTAMEDTGTLQALAFLAKAGKVDSARVLVLRTASNYDSQPPHLSAWESLAANRAGNYAGLEASLDSAWRVGSVVVRELAQGWTRWRNEIPSAPATPR